MSLTSPYMYRIHVLGNLVLQYFRLHCREGYRIKKVMGGPY